MIRSTISMILFCVLTGNTRVSFLSSGQYFTPVVTLTPFLSTDPHVNLPQVSVPSEKMSDYESNIREQHTVRDSTRDLIDLVVI